MQSESPAMSNENLNGTGWDDVNGCLWFEAVREGRSVLCCIDALCLYFAFGANSLVEVDATKAYAFRRSWIHSAALSKASRGEFERDSIHSHPFVRVTARDI